MTSKVWAQITYPIVNLNGSIFEVWVWLSCFIPRSIIYITISKNIRYLLWNRGAWPPLNNTHLTFLDPCIRCTNHLCDSCDLTDVNPHFIPSLLRKIQNVDLLWRHRYRSRPPAIVTSQWPIVPVWLLWTVIFKDLPRFSTFWKKIYEAVKCLASDVMIDWQRAMRTARNNGL